MYDLAVLVAQDGVIRDVEAVVECRTVDLKFKVGTRLSGIQPHAVCDDFAGELFTVDGQNAVYDKRQLVFRKVRGRQDGGVKDLIVPAFFHPEGGKKQQEKENRQ